MVIHKTVSSTYTNNNINQTSFSSNNIQPYQHQTINFTQPKYHHHKSFSFTNVLDSPVFPVVQRKNLTSKDLGVAKKTTEFTNNTDSKLNINSTSSTRPVYNSTATMSRHHHKMFESIAKSCIVSRNCTDSKNHPVLKNRPDSQNQRAASNNYISTPTKNCIESKSKNLAVCANADNDPLSKSLDSHSLRVLKLAKNEFSVIAKRRFKKDEFILQYSGDVHSAKNFLQLKYEYSNLDTYFDLFVERNHDNTMNGNIYAPFINRSDTPNCYIQITKEGSKKDDGSNNCDSKHSVYKVGIFALYDIVPGVELKLGLNLIENGNLTPVTQQNRSHPTANSASYHSQPPRTLLPSDHPSQSSSQLDQANDSFPMSIQITSEERRHHNKFQNLVTAIQLLETSIVNYCIEHAQDPIISPVEKLSETAVMLFGLPQSMFSRVHAVISICLRENIGIDQCQTCLLNAFRLFLEWTTGDGGSETNKSSSTPIQWSTSSSRFHRRYHGSRNSNIKISLFEKFVTCFLLSLKGTFDVIPISILVWSERLSISKYRLVRWELECLKAIRFEVMITSTLYFCWLGKLCDELEV